MTTNDICIEDECVLPVLIKTRRLCSGHYQKYLRRVNKESPNWKQNTERPTSRICTDCREDLPIVNFEYKHKKYNKSTRRVCRACAGVRLKISRKGITIDRYLQMLEEQDHRCKICNFKFEAGGRRPSIDHDHGCCAGAATCGKCVRGLLCVRCNTGIGMLQDNPNILKKALDYLENGIIDQ